MTWSNKELAELAAAERRSVAPSQQDRERIREALRVRFAPSTSAIKEVPSLAGQRATAAVSGSKGSKLWLSGAGLAAVAMGLTLALRKPQSTAVAEFAPPTALSVVLAVASSEEPLPVNQEQQAPLVVEAASVQPEVRGPGTPQRARAPASDALAQEIALIVQAEKDFHTGDLRASLTRIDEHRRRFPRGVLMQERRRLRVQVLCRLGRVQELESGERGAEGNGVPLCSTGTANGAP